MNYDILSSPEYLLSKYAGLDFLTLFKEQDGGRVALSFGIAYECNLSLHYTEHDVTH